MAFFKKENAINYLKGVFFALVVALVFVLIFALILRFCGGAGEAVIGIINGLIRIAAAATGCFFYSREKGLLRGLFMGVSVYFFVYLLFGVISGSWKAGASQLLNFLLTTAAGCIFGVLFSNLKNKR
ncbi:MAG: TIGR04086 family membrane protein [Candidatus Borkfalkiaceae bacterium]|nr:TIGR04086 family membrane protein [Christensenellaceae bacterium]